MSWSQNVIQGLSRQLHFVFVGADFVSLFLGGWFLYYLRFQTPFLSVPYGMTLCIALVSNYCFFSYFHIYRLSSRLAFWHHFRQLFKGCMALILFLMGLAFIFKVGAFFSRSWFIWWMAFYFVLLLCNRLCLFFIFNQMRARGWNQRRIAIIGCNQMTEEMIQRLDKSLWTGYKVTIIWVEDADQATSLNGYPVLPIPDHLSLFVQKHHIAEVWFMFPLKKMDVIHSLRMRLSELAIPIRMMLNPDELTLFEYTITEVAGFPTLNLNASPIVGINRFVKGLEDRLLAVCILIAISPLFLLIMLMIKLTSKDSIFFKQKRLGWDGKIINVYKFRTMCEHQDEPGMITQATLGDDRITPFGRFLRKTSLDELPQFINVLQGRMSIVGPRPHALAHNDAYKGIINAYMQRHRVKPGITGWAQVNGWRGETDTLHKMQKRVEYDLYYIRHWSLSFDLKIIMLTLFKGFVHQNAY